MVACRCQVVGFGSRERVGAKLAHLGGTAALKEALCFHEDPRGGSEVADGVELAALLKLGLTLLPRLLPREFELVLLPGLPMASVAVTR